MRNGLDYVIHECSPQIPIMTGPFLFQHYRLRFPLYKYTKKEFAERFFDNGELLIGTIYDFQDEAKYGSKIGDSKEGWRKIISLNGEPVFLKGNCINAFTYCVSDRLDRNIAEDFESNCVIQINSIEFFKILTSIISSKMNIFSTIDFVKYMDDEEIIQHTRNLWNGARKISDVNRFSVKFSRLKERRFSHQSEIRAIWEPLSLAARLWPSGIPLIGLNGLPLLDELKADKSPINSDLTPFIMNCLKLRDHCELINI